MWERRKRQRCLVAAVVATGVMLGACASRGKTGGTTGGAGGAGGAVPENTGQVPPGGAGQPPAPAGGGGVAGQAAIPDLGGDAHILTAIDVANTDEIQAGMVARDKATAKRVRDFADRMIQDHTKLQAQTRDFVQRQQLTAPDSANFTLQMQQSNQAALQQLQNTPRGAAFDALYITQQVAAHRQTLALLDAGQKQATNTQLRDLIKAATPQVQAHLDEALAIQRELGGAPAPADSGAKSGMPPGTSPPRDTTSDTTSRSPSRTPTP